MVNLTLRFFKSCFFLPIATHVIISVEKTNAEHTNCKHKPVVEELRELSGFNSTHSVQEVYWDPLFCYVCQ